MEKLQLNSICVCFKKGMEYWKNQFKENKKGGFLLGKLERGTKRDFFREPFYNNSMISCLTLKSFRDQMADWLACTKSVLGWISKRIFKRIDTTAPDQAL